MAKNFLLISDQHCSGENVHYNLMAKIKYRLISEKGQDDNYEII